MKRKIRPLAVAAGVALLAIAFGTGTAQADPVGPPSPRDLVGMGSDTTDQVVNAIAETPYASDGIKHIGSFDALGSATVNTGRVGCSAVPRANGSTAGRNALIASLNAGDNCLQFARSSSGPVATTPALRWAEFAVDAVTFAVTSNSSIPRRLTRAEITAIYNCQGDPSWTPLIPQAGSGTRAFWLSFVGLTETTIPACVKDTIPAAGGGTTPVEEHDGRVLNNTRVIPFSVAQYIAQSTQTIADRRGPATLGVIDGTSPLLLNSAIPGNRKVYNVIPDAQTGNPLYQAAFIGSNSHVCQQSATIQRYGFGVLATCGTLTP